MDTLSLHIPLPDYDDTHQTRNEYLQGLLKRRWKIEDQIKAEGIGEVSAGGMGFGEMDICVEVADADEATRRLRQLAIELCIDEMDIHQHPPG